ncbi:hypothetical protein AW27_023065 [Streptomyces sp. PCS3-D2]|uniref:hypothetical protein n=1 Tax=Streptomyces sp. PCS3-D2 TaxID=1460244 RepID=UPI00044ABAD1|nr:hypothetical protein [Streptomyces sp. PCS3-D2]WKV74126.1 hypothetical protein AW27_023065 [Streptomyces sp. PCS3-D2]
MTRPSHHYFHEDLEHDVFDLLATRTALIVTANLLRAPAEHRSPLELATQGGVLWMWERATPELRRILLLQAAWEARGRFTGEADDDAARYAGYFSDAAAEAAASGVAERTNFVHVATPAFMAAQSLAFDRDENAVSLVATLLLAQRIQGRWI